MEDSEWYPLLFLFTISWHVQIKGFGALIYTAEEPHRVKLTLFLSRQKCVLLYYTIHGIQLLSPIISKQECIR